MSRPAWAMLWLAASGCAALAVEPTPSQVAKAEASWPGTTAASLEQGRMCFTARCSNCHAPPDPTRRPSEAWPLEVARMSRPAHLTPEQAEEISRYLQAVSR